MTKIMRFFKNCKKTQKISQKFTKFNKFHKNFQKFYEKLPEGKKIGSRYSNLIQYHFKVWKAK